MKIYSGTVSSSKLPYSTSKTYYYRMRAVYYFADGGKAYSVWSDTVTIKPETYVRLRLNYLKTVYPDGKYWCRHGTVKGGTDTGVSDVSCGHCIPNYYVGKSSEAVNGIINAKQCHGFASLISDEIFGKNTKVTKVSKLSNLKVGDFIRIYTPFVHPSSHSFIVTNIYANGTISAVECNANGKDCQIWWKRTGRMKLLSLDYIKSCYKYCIVTRY